MTEKANRKHPTQLIVALDCGHFEQAMQVVDSLRGLDIIYKVGSELFLAAGPDVVKELVHRDLPVFLDLKFHDIPNTVARAARQAAFLQVDMFTVHLAGGSKMVRAVAEEFENEVPSLRPKVLGVSVLTSFDDVRWAEVTRAITGHATTTEESVEGLIESGALWGVDGIVCSAAELPIVRRRWPGLYTVVPGIRPAGAETGDQARVMTPAEARSAGAHAIVVGRPICGHDDPRAAAESILQDLSAPLPAAVR